MIVRKSLEMNRPEKFPSVDSSCEDVGSDNFDQSIKDLHSRRMEWVKSVDDLLNSGKTPEHLQESPGKGDESRRSPESQAISSHQSFNEKDVPGDISPVVFRPPEKAGDISSVVFQPPEKADVHENKYTERSPEARKRLTFKPEPPRRTRGGRSIGRMRISKMRMSRSLNRLNIRLKAVKQLQRWWKNRLSRKIVLRWKVIAQLLVQDSRRDRVEEQKDDRGRIEVKESVKLARFTANPTLPRSPDAPKVQSFAANSSFSTSYRALPDPEIVEKGYRGMNIPKSWKNDVYILRPGSLYPGVEKARAYAKGYITRIIFSSNVCQHLKSQAKDIQAMIVDIENEGQRNPYQVTFRRQLDKQMNKIRLKIASLFEPGNNRDLVKMMRKPNMVNVPAQQSRPMTAPPGKRTGAPRKRIERKAVGVTSKRPVSAGTHGSSGSGPKLQSLRETDVTVRFEPGPVGLVFAKTSARVKMVHTGKQAEGMGVRPGWTVTEVNGQAVTDPRRLMISLASLKDTGKPFTIGFSTENPVMQHNEPKRVAWGEPNNENQESPSKQGKFVSESPNKQEKIIPDVNKEAASKINEDLENKDMHESTRMLLENLSKSIQNSTDAVVSPEGNTADGPRRSFLRRKRGKVKVSHKLNWDAKSRISSKLETKYIKPKVRKATKKPISIKRKKIDLSKVKSRIDSHWSRRRSSSFDEDSAVETPVKASKQTLETTIKKNIRSGMPVEIMGDKSNFFISVSDYREMMHSPSQLASSSPEAPEYEDEKRHNLRYSHVDMPTSGAHERWNQQLRTSRQLLRKNPRNRRLDGMSSMLNDIVQTVELLIGEKDSLHIFDPPTAETEIPYIIDPKALYDTVGKNTSSSSMLQTLLRPSYVLSNR